METTIERYYGTGRRKTAIAKVWITPGQGQFTVNGMQATEYFNRITHQKLIFGPLKDTGMLEKVNVKAITKGGGISGHAGAVRLGVARALLELNEEGFRKKLRACGHVTRDPRMKERKKFGQPGARKKYQYSKR